MMGRPPCRKFRQSGVATEPRDLPGEIDDGAYDSDNVIGDVIEALIGALYLDHGLDAAQAFIRRHWEPLLSGQTGAPRHPKSALQEWAAAHNRKPPAYSVTDRSGPHHAPRFTVKVSLGQSH